MLSTCVILSDGCMMQTKLNTTQVFLNQILEINPAIDDVAFHLNIKKTRLDKMIAGEFEATDKEFKSILTWWVYYRHKDWPAYRSAIEVCESIKDAAHA